MAQKTWSIGRIRAVSRGALWSAGRPRPALGSWIPPRRDSPGRRSGKRREDAAHSKAPWRKKSGNPDFLPVFTGPIPSFDLQFTGGGARTPTPFRTQDFESSASANSATPATTFPGILRGIYSPCLPGTTRRQLADSPFRKQQNFLKLWAPAGRNDGTPGGGKLRGECEAQLAARGDQATDAEPEQAQGPIDQFFPPQNRAGHGK